MLRASAIAVASLGFALLAFLAAAGNARGPISTLGLLSPLPTRGFVLAGQSNALAAASESARLTDKKLALARDAAAIALRAYREEPLSVSPVRNIALLEAQQGHTDRAVELMDLVAQTTRRDHGANLWLARYYGQRGDIGRMLTLLDASLRSSEKVSDLVLPVLMQAVPDPKAVAPLTSLLVSNPSWAPEFWSILDRHPRSQPNLALIRANLHRAKVPLDPEDDRKLIYLLVSAGNIAEGEQLAMALPKKYRLNARPPGEFVVNGGFSRAVGLPPFDWELTATSDFEAYIDPERGALNVSSFGDLAGLVARELVRLPAGPIELKSVVAELNGDAESAPYLALQCAEKDAQPRLIKVNLKMGTTRRLIDNAQRHCRYNWLQLFVSPAPEGRQVDAVVSEISIRSARLHS